MGSESSDVKQPGAGAVLNRTENFEGTTLFSGGGELGALMAAKDWAQTPLGPVANWPQNLRTCVRIVLTSRQPMFVWWGDELINLYNDAYKSIVGDKHPACLGQPAQVVWHEIWEQVGPRAESAIRDNKGTYDEAALLIMERYGYPEETYYTFSYSPVPDDHGGIGGIICANTDDTQRITGERQMQLLRGLAMRTADARTRDEACRLSAESLASDPQDICFALIYVADSGKNSVQLAGSTGMKAGTEVAANTIQLGGDSVWPIAQALVTHQIQVVNTREQRLPRISAEVWDYPVQSVAVVPIAPSGPNGRAGALVVGLSPVRKFDDSYRGFLALVAGQISASIANAAAYEEERRRAEALAELDRAKTTFFSNVSHEFRTPLTLMLGPLEDLLAQPAAQESNETRGELEVIHRNGLRLLKLVNALLDFSRIEAGRVDARYEAVDLASYTAELASVFRSAMEKAGLRYSVRGDAASQPTYVDREMWEKVVLNLLSNALKFTLRGQVDVEVRTSLDHAELIVSDTGSGIPESELPRVFDRFHRVEGARGRTHEGTGIGLALVDELVRLHGGTVRVESRVGEGTKFTVRIPQGNSHLPAEKIVHGRALRAISAETSPYVQEALRWLPDNGNNALTSTEPDSGNEDLTSLFNDDSVEEQTSSGRILLVDDNLDMREYVQRLLARNYTVIPARDGQEALELARANPPDLVLTDVMMPRMDGFQLLKALREDPRTQTLPVIMLSARAGEESRVEGMEAGADDYLVKPFTARELMARVGAHLSMKHIREELRQREQKEQRRAETAEAQYQRILESISEGFLFVDTDWIIRHCNGVYAGFARCTPQDLIGAKLWEKFPETADTKFETIYRDAMLNQTEAEIEDYYEPLDAWFHVHLYPTADGLAMFVADVTAQRRQRQALLVSEKLAAAGRLASTVAHEINNPLESVVNLLYLARRATVQEQREQYLDYAEREINRVSHIARQTLGFYRETTNLTRIPVAAVVETLLQVYQGKLKSKNIAVDTVIQPDLQITARTGELNQVLSNLITNAIDASAAGGHLTIVAKSIPAENAVSAVQIRVTDNGTGIKPEDLSRVFEPFFTTKKDVGTGLGLWVVKQIVEGSKGTVQIESSTDGENRGTTVVLVLPELEETKAKSASTSSPAA
jgi:signal transduction histidine kinase/DNA-binding NarL/FixJ family response regulator